ncbi:MAG TPA: ABC transporter substrate-binding protein [Stellaceae bacterium]|jgi:NitT/TauT family transport system substrate-binding protein|nr:ABC transporter substrate-binding protein [Stellaceae bacterium]
MRQAALLAAIILALAAPARAADPVTVTYASFDALYAPYFLALDHGYFAQQDLDVTLLQAGGGTATPALIAGSVQFSSSSGSAITAILRGAKLKVIMTMAVSLPWKLWATSPAITSLADLKGQPVGVETSGGLDELALRGALMKAGLPQDYVAYDPVGVGGAQRIAIMEHAALPAIFLSYIEERIARQRGALDHGHVLIDFPHDLKMPYNGLATSDALIAGNPGLVGRFVTAVAMGMRAMTADRAATLAALAKYAKNTAPEALAEALDDTAPTVLANAEATPDQRQFDLTLRATMLSLPASALPPLDKVYDYSFAEHAIAALDKEGWKP